MAGDDDVNSTVAAALCAVKLVVPVARVEAGLAARPRNARGSRPAVTDQLAGPLFTTVLGADEDEVV